ncbi:TIGR03943 family protein [Naasia sp. SYSU D00948]|uniref:TIGR03943 family putative permease subunit n=1 Tax=Naasia sp. SYSU D00948 TaxID=2817379 RepID=UPI001B301A11|nr:TIGR03943 family protein [Naasia sp. SYSU D00948]
MLDRLTGRWTGIALSLLTVLGTLWLALTGNLDLYVHPRYYAFTIAMGVIGGLTSLAALLLLPSSERDEHDHAVDDIPVPAHRRVLSVVGRVLLVAIAAVVLLALPPTTLTSALAADRELNSAAATETSATSPDLAETDGSTFSVKDWAGLLRQGLPADYFQGKTADVTGFVLDTGADDVFYLARFHITHCALDAQPVGIPVHWPGWRQELQTDEWLAVVGGFRSNPLASEDAPVVLMPSESRPVNQPEDPYVY